MYSFSWIACQCKRENRCWLFSTPHMFPTECLYQLWLCASIYHYSIIMEMLHAFSIHRVLMRTAPYSAVIICHSKNKNQSEGQRRLQTMMSTNEAVHLVSTMVSVYISHGQFTQHDLLVYFQHLGPSKDMFSQGISALAILKTGEVIVGAGDGTVSVCGTLEQKFKRQK